MCLSPVFCVVDLKVYRLVRSKTAAVRPLSTDLSRRTYNLVIRQTRSEADMVALKSKVEGMQNVTEDGTTLTHKAAGAGTIRRALLKLGGACYPQLVDLPLHGRC